MRKKVAFYGKKLKEVFSFFDVIILILIKKKNCQLGLPGLEMLKIGLLKIFGG
jgi:hypothetical protein